VTETAVSPPESALPRASTPKIAPKTVRLARAKPISDGAPVGKYRTTIEYQAPVPHEQLNRGHFPPQQQASHDEPIERETDLAALAALLEDDDDDPDSQRRSTIAQLREQLGEHKLKLHVQRIEGGQPGAMSVHPLPPNGEIEEYLQDVLGGGEFICSVKDAGKFVRGLKSLHYKIEAPRQREVHQTQSGPVVINTPAPRQVDPDKAIDSAFEHVERVAKLLNGFQRQGHRDAPEAVDAIAQVETTLALVDRINKRNNPAKAEAPPADPIQEKLYQKFLDKLMTKLDDDEDDGEGYSAVNPDGEFNVWAPLVNSLAPLLPQIGMALIAWLTAPVQPPPPATPRVAPRPNPYAERRRRSQPSNAQPPRNNVRPITAQREDQAQQFQAMFDKLMTGLFEAARDNQPATEAAKPVIETTKHPMWGSMAASFLKTLFSQTPEALLTQLKTAAPQNAAQFDKLNQDQLRGWIAELQTEVSKQL